MAETESTGLEQALLAVARQMEDQGSAGAPHYLRRCVANLRDAWSGAEGYEDPNLALVIIRDSAQSLLEAMHHHGAL
ncbi:hypothetical protein E1181_00915 [Saccharopolyspora terrae]|uniref:Uncharacterized protein n=1 Tax=Saccharopolyspora terrae TaxID=2530384 RepID=A0A4R4VWX0_9PSEU|nr:hypothetical protein [Saccharopolyspora terrae]TDD10619.1 hypothetical protein E1181_00915 [Saccharopolyspora terrae]